MFVGNVLVFLGVGKGGTWAFVTVTFESIVMMGSNNGKNGTVNSRASAVTAMSDCDSNGD